MGWEDTRPCTVTVREPITIYRQRAELWQVTEFVRPYPVCERSKLGVNQEKAEQPTDSFGSKIINSLRYTVGNTVRVGRNLTLPKLEVHRFINRAAYTLSFSSLEGNNLNIWFIWTKNFPNLQKILPRSVTEYGKSVNECFMNPITYQSKSLCRPTVLGTIAFGDENRFLDKPQMIKMEKDNRNGQTTHPQCHLNIISRWSG